MGWWYFSVVTLHVLAAMVWIGGNAFFALVGAPALRRVEPASLRVQLFEAMGTRFRYVGWVSIVLLVLTGLAAMSIRGWLRRDVLLDARFWATPTGTALMWKLISVGLMVVLAALHDVLLSPARWRERGASPEWANIRRRLVLLARAATLVAVVVVAAAVRLVRS